MSASARVAAQPGKFRGRRKITNPPLTEIYDKWADVPVDATIRLAAYVNFGDESFL